jgi:hypothetical protein
MVVLGLVPGPTSNDLPFWLVWDGLLCLFSPRLATRQFLRRIRGYRVLGKFMMFVQILEDEWGAMKGRNRGLSRNYE